MPPPVNLNRYRKAKARAEAKARADENAVKFGQPKSALDDLRKQIKNNDRLLADHRLDVGPQE